MTIIKINKDEKHDLEKELQSEKEKSQVLIEEKERQIEFYKDLKTISYLRVFPSQANFFLCEVTSKYTSAELANELIKRNILISNCSTKRFMKETGKQLIRLAIRDRKDDTTLIEVLRSLE